MRPMPGWRKQQTPLTVSEPMKGPGPAEFKGEAGFKPSSGRLAENALSLLMVVPKLRTLGFHRAIAELQERLVGEITEFQNRSLQQGFSEQQVRVASYLICSFIDETVLNTPWGAQSNWGHDSLLVRFHKEALGGEEFFQTLERLLQRPAQNLDLLELAYLCLSLGFEGKYRFGADGLRELEKLRTEVFLVIQRSRADAESGLSVHWQGMRDLRSPLTRHVPIWVMVAVAALLLLTVYLGLSYALSSASNRIFSQWMAIASEEGKLIPEIQVATSMPVQDQLIIPVQPPKSATRTQRYRELLADEIAKKMVEVLEGPIVRIINAFPSASDQMQNTFLPALDKVGQELKRDPARVEVFGYTDNVPIFSARFPSNWDLSNARAKKVAAQLDPSGSMRESVTFKGRAENDPIVPNDTPEHRAMNRRVDIHVR